MVAMKHSTRQLLPAVLLAASSASASAVPAATFTYTDVTSTRYATALPSPLTYSKSYAPAYSKASSLLPANITYTTWSLDRQATATPDGAYGQSAYASLWATLSYSSDVPFTTTVSPTPVATSELVYPPQLPFVPVNQSKRKLPADFIWGVAGSAWQIEGGIMSEGRGPSLLDSYGALPNTDQQNDSVAADMNYFMYKQDIARLAAMGVPYYAFSVDWPRIVPFYYADTPVNQQGLDHYEDLVATCVAYGVTPIVTLNHNSYPAAYNLSDQATFIAAFMYYAKIVTVQLGDRVPVLFTFNEPNIGVDDDAGNGYTTLLLAHARFYHWYKDTLQGTGKVAFKFANNLAIPLRLGSADDVAAALRYQEFLLGIMGNPVFLGQQYPDVVLATPGQNITALTDAEIAEMYGTCDFWAIDPYTAQIVTTPGGAGSAAVAACAANTSHSLWPLCVDEGSTMADGWLIGRQSNTYPYIAPQFVRQQMGYIYKTYRPPWGILITEFGFPEYAEVARPLADQVMDLDRALYYHAFLSEATLAMYEDGVPLVGALAWSFLDNNEFGSMDEHYGLQTVNHTDGVFTRRYKRSMFDFVDYFHAHVAN